jgi:hypothetical protein
MLKRDPGTLWSLARGMLVTVGRALASVRSTLAMIGSRSGCETSAATFDPVRVEAELDEALYGQRTGTECYLQNVGFSCPTTGYRLKADRLGPGAGQGDVAFVAAHAQALTTRDGLGAVQSERRR